MLIKPIDCIQQMRSLKKSIAYQEYASENIVRESGKFDSKQKNYKLVLFINIFWISREYLLHNYHSYNKRLINNLIHLSYFWFAIILVCNFELYAYLYEDTGYLMIVKIMIKYVITKFQIWNSKQILWKK